MSDLRDKLYKLYEMNFEGNVIPHSWYSTIKKNNKPDTTAILILAEIVYWYRPTVIAPKSANQPVQLKKKFGADKLQKSYAELEAKLGFSQKQCREALKRLKDLGVVDIEFRHFRTKSGLIISNVMFLDIDVDRLRELTFPPMPEIEDENENQPIFVTGTNRLAQTGNMGFPNGQHGFPEKATWVSQTGNTYTKTTTKNTTQNTQKELVASATLDSDLNSKTEGVDYTQHLNEKEKEYLLEYEELVGHKNIRYLKGEIKALKRIVETGITLDDFSYYYDYLKENGFYEDKRLKLTNMELNLVEGISSDTFKYFKYDRRLDDEDYPPEDDD